VAVCEGTTVDLTLPAITAGSDAGLTFSYFEDADATTPLTYPEEVDVTGIYYIVGATSDGCADTAAVNVTITDKPMLVINDPVAVCEGTTVDLTLPAITAGSDAGLTFEYYEDEAATISLINYTAISESGIYYIKATTDLGCSAIKPVEVTIYELPILAITDPDQVCDPATIDLTDPSITDGITAGLTFTYWKDSEATLEVDNPEAISISGIYYIKGTSDTGCYSIKEVNVTINDLPIIIITNATPVCEPGTVDLTSADIVQGSEDGLIYTYWADELMTIGITNPKELAIGGTYYICAENISGCAVIMPVEVTINLRPKLTITDPEPVCDPETVDITVAEVTSGSDNDLFFTYFEDTEGTIPLSDPSAISSSGIYYIMAENQHGCINIKGVNVTINNGVLTEVTETACEEFTWAAGNGNRYTQSGIYDYIVANADGCSDTLRLNLTINQKPDITIIETHPDCDISTGRITVSSETGGLTFSINGSEFAPYPAEGFIGLNPGNYTITVRNTANCQSAADATIDPVPDAPDKPVLTVTQLTCDITTGSITITSPTGTGFEYSIDGANWQKGAIFAGLDPGDYTVTVRNEEGCLNTEKASISAITEMKLTAVPSHVNCYGGNDGVITLTVEGGLAPYKYLWSNGATTSDISGLAVGNYSVTVTDKNNCEAKRSVTILQPDMALLVKEDYTHVTIKGKNDGKITITAEGGTPAYTYLWNTGQTTPSLTGLAPGEYTVTVRDANNCEVTLTITITEPEANYSLIPPPTIRTCAFSALPPKYETFEQFKAAGGAAITDCPNGDFDPATFRMISEISDRKSCPETVIRKYQITDMCGNIAEGEQIIILEDNEPPRVTPPPPRTFECIAELNDPFYNFTSVQKFKDDGGIVSDNCTPVDELTIRRNGPDEITGTSCLGQVRRRYIITDRCGNEKPVEVLYEIKDNRAPTPVPRPNITVTCEIPPRYANYAAFVADGGLAIDNCGNITLRFIDEYVVTDGCPKVVKRIYHLVDACNNFRPFEQIITIVDETKPVFETINPLYIYCDSGSGSRISAWLNSVKATDDCKSKVTITNNYDELSLPSDCCGPVTVTFTASDMCGNSSTDYGVINFKAIASVEIEIDQNPVCEGFEVTLTADPTNGGTNPQFTWYRNGAPVAGVTGTTYSYLPTDGDRIYVELVSSNTCVDDPKANSEIITISVVKELPVSVTLASDQNNVCEDTTVTLTANPVNGGSNPVYTWYLNNLPLTGVSGPTYSYVPKNNDEIYVTLTNNEQCVTGSPATSNTVILTVNKVKSPSVSIEYENKAVCEDAEITFVSKAIDEGINPIYQWYVNNLPKPGETNETFTYVPNDGDIVHLELTSSEVCVDKKTIISNKETINLIKIDPIYIACPGNISIECLKDAPPALTLTDFLNNNWITNPKDIDKNSFRIDSSRVSTQNRISIERTYYISDICDREVSCTQRIELTDIIPPDVVERDIIAYLDENGEYVVTRDDILESASDNCTDFENLTIIANPPVLYCSDIGVSVRVDITVFDEAGNKTEVDATVTSLDTIRPAPICQDITIELDQYGRASITAEMIDNGSSDNCEYISIRLDRTSFTCDDIGKNKVILTVRDKSGNISECTAVVTVIDNIPPVAICKPLIVYLGPSGVVTLTPTMIDGGSTDNCGAPKFEISRSYFSCDNVGEHIVTLYVKDKFGNVDSCSTKVTIIGNLPPIARDDNVKALANQNTMILVLLNDSDPNGSIDPTSVWIIDPPKHGSLAIHPINGSIMYRPTEDYLGNDSFVYRVCDDGKHCGTMCDTAVVKINVVEDNIAPVAVDDRFEGGCLAISGNILRNDYDPDFDNIILNRKLLSQPQHGTFEMFADGSFFYVSNKGFVGIDNFSYQICDDGFPVKCDTATVYFDIFMDENCDGIPDVMGEEFFIPEGFSPNGDGIHDFFQIVGIEDFPDARMMIFNRWGNKLFEKEKYGNLNYWGSHEEAWWWGYSESRLNFGNSKVPVGNYLYILELGNGKTYKGTVMVSY
jgi:gliding motility-associated-like protein